MMTATENNRLRLVMLPAAVLLFGAGPVQPTLADDAVRTSVTRQGSGGRDAVLGERVEQHYGALQTGGSRASGGGAGKESATSSAKSGRNDFWIYTADVVLFGDDDNDGYFHGIDLLFDADTFFEVADVYAVLYLSLEGGPWNEYAVTDDFAIFGATSDDEYVVVTELKTGYPRGSYDLLIELYDSVDGTFLTSFGPENSSELALLPLEDFDRDAPLVDEVVVIGHGGGGASGVVTLLLLAVTACSRRRRQLAAAGCRRASRMTLRPQRASESK